MASSRFLVAGAVLYLFMRYGKGERVPRAAWKPAWIMGALLLLGGNGGVVYAEQYVPSGITALMVGCGPFWFLLLGWLWLKGPRPGVLAIGGLLIGFTGLAVLIGPGRISGSAGHVPLMPALLVLGATISWSVGSIYSKTLRSPVSPMMMSGMQMLTGSVLMVVAGLIHGEHRGFSIGNITLLSWGSWAYLVVFGSLVGFSAYIYVLRHATPAVASTYAYVNPVVAVFLGWAVASEPITGRTLVAASMIIGAVILISWPRKRAEISPGIAAVDDPVAPEHV
jgi:drug/metabolite transporter (DMT)-like permease